MEANYQNLYTIVYHLYKPLVKVSGVNKRVSVPVSLPIGLKEAIDRLVEEGEFSSRSEALRFGARLVVLFGKRTHERAVDYGYSEIKKGIERGKKPNVS